MVDCNIKCAMKLLSVFNRLLLGWCTPLFLEVAGFLPVLAAAVAFCLHTSVKVVLFF